MQAAELAEREQAGGAVLAHTSSSNLREHVVGMLVASGSEAGEGAQRGKAGGAAAGPSSPLHPRGPILPGLPVLTRACSEAWARQNVVLSSQCVCARLCAERGPRRAGKSREHVVFTNVQNKTTRSELTPRFDALPGDGGLTGLPRQVCALICGELQKEASALLHEEARPAPQHNPSHASWSFFLQHALLNARGQCRATLSLRQGHFKSGLLATAAGNGA